MIVTNNIFAVPIILIIWAADLYLFSASARLILGKLPRVQSSRLTRTLAELVDPLPQRVQRTIALRRNRPIPAWLLWATVIVSMILLRYVLVSVVVSMS